MNNGTKFSREGMAALVRAAESGDISAAAQIGDAYREGVGVAQDDGQALYWYRVAADGGHMHAQNTLGNMILHGLGCAEDPESALGWHEASAEQGLSVAQFNAGMGYLAAMDSERARYWLGKAAEQGEIGALREIGTMHRLGLGTEPNVLRAAQFHILAAEGGDALARTHLEAESAALSELALGGNREAAFVLFQMSQGGYGVEKSAAAAWSWLIWAYNGCDRSDGVWLENKTVPEAIRFCGEFLTRGQRAEAERMLAGRRTADGGPLLGKPRVILKVGAEGGSLTLLGRWTLEGWRYKFHVNDSMWAFADEAPVAEKPVVLNSWPAALKAMDRYPWQQLYPLQAHPEFGSRILAARRRRCGSGGKSSGDSRWEGICGGKLADGDDQE